MSEEKTGAEAGQTGVDQAGTETKTVDTDKTTVKEKTFTQKQLDEAVGKTQSTFETKAAQARREAEEARRLALAAEERAAQAEKRLAEQESEKRRAWEDSVADLPEGQRLIAERRRIDQEKAEAERLHAEATRRKSEGEFGLKAANAIEIAEREGVNYKDLMSEGSKAEMEAKAARLKVAQLEKELAELKTKQEKPPAEPEVKETESITPDHVDSGVINRPSKLLSKDTLNEKYAHGDIGFEEYQEGMKKLGG